MIMRFKKDATTRKVSLSESYGLEGVITCKDVLRLE